MKRLLLTLIFFLILVSVNAQKKPVIPSRKDISIDDSSFLRPTPKFPGGQKAFYKFLNKNLKWPNPQIDAQGRVIISFFVEKDGRLTNFKVERGLGKPFDQEALRVLKKSPRWIPAKQNRKPVKVKYYVPINFTLSE
jgi:protein TonB